MKIGIDARVLDRKMTGVGRYLKNLLDGIPLVDKVNEYYVFINNDSLIDTTFYKQIRVKESRLPDKIYSPIWLNFILPAEIKKYNLDIFFACNFLQPLKTLGTTKKVSVVHDVIHKAEKKFFPLSYRIYLGVMLPITFYNADIILTDSEYSKKDILRFYPSTKNKLHILFTSADKKFHPRELSSDEKESLINKYKLPAKFLLYVGVIEKRKNIEGLFQIANKLEERGISIPIVVVGRTGFGYDDIEQRAAQTKGKIVYINFVDERDLHKLYTLAYLFLFPSFYEGFGIPPLEAMQSGVPVISSNASSLPEVLGNSAVQLPPTDIDKFVIEIEKFLNYADYYETWRKKGIERANEFDVIKSAQQFVNIINNG